MILKSFKNVAAVVFIILLLLIVLRVFDVSVNTVIPAPDNDESLAFGACQIDTAQKVLFDSIDMKIKSIVAERNASSPKHVVDSLARLVRVGTPSSTYKSIKNPNYAHTPDSTWWKSDQKRTFYVVTTAGYIVDRNGQVQYFMPSYGARYYYEITLPYGTYAYLTMNNDQYASKDTISFAVNKSGVYKLGYVEDHKSFLIFKDSSLNFY